MVVLCSFYVMFDGVDGECEKMARSLILCGRQFCEKSSGSTESSADFVPTIHFMSLLILQPQK